MQTSLNLVEIENFWEFWKIITLVMIMKVQHKVCIGSDKWSLTLFIEIIWFVSSARIHSCEKEKGFQWSHKFFLHLLSSFQGRAGLVWTCLGSVHKNVCTCHHYHHCHCVHLSTWLPSSSSSSCALVLWGLAVCIKTYCALVCFSSSSSSCVHLCWWWW